MSRQTEVPGTGPWDRKGRLVITIPGFTSAGVKHPISVENGEYPNSGHIWSDGARWI
jgi:hypothetical protein